MITHNGKYLFHATHHGMPIVAATMGGKMVIGGWLLPLTLQAIVAAFGSAEGTEVIAKTNDYLNRIATTDPQREQALAGFIDEDPMLVCSLVETSKTRWLVGDGKAYLDTGFNLTADLTFEVQTNKLRMGVHNGTTQVNSPSLFAQPTLTGSAYAIYITSWTATPAIETSSFSLELTSSQVLMKDSNGQTKVTIARGANIARPIYLFASNGTNGYAFIGLEGCTTGRAHFKNASQEIDLIPHQRPDGQCGMLDIISGTFYPNANTEGSFTIALTSKTTS